MKTILQILPALQSGGVERGTIDIAISLKEQGFNSLVMSKGGALVKILEDNKIKHIALDVATKNPFKILQNSKKISEIIKANKVDIVHVRSRAPMWSAYGACKKNNMKIISTIHGPYSLGSGFIRFFKKFYNAKMLKADKIIVVSNFIKDYVLTNYKVDVVKLKLIHRGVDINKFDSKEIDKSEILNLKKDWKIEDEKRKIILMPARFTSWKGHEFLIDALAKVKTDFLCILIGSNHGHESYQQRIFDKILKLKLADNIRIFDACQNMPLAYAISDIVVCPSIKPEAFGRIPIEAQAMKKPIISTNIGGALETVINNKSGFLVEPNNDEDLANIISVVLEFDEKKLQEIGEAGRKNVEDNFSNQKMIATTLDLYKSCH